MKILKRFSLLLIVVLIIGINFIGYYYFTNWTFTKPEYIRLYNAISGLLLFGSLIGIFVKLLLKSKNPLLNILYGILIVFFFFIALLHPFLIYNPIDTNTEPRDVKILSKNNSSSKVVREVVNIKHGYPIYDTVIVKDYWIFREVQKKD